jgi:hypothetical protein
MLTKAHMLSKESDSLRPPLPTVFSPPQGKKPQLLTPPYLVALALKHRIFIKLNQSTGFQTAKWAIL